MGKWLDNYINGIAVLFAGYGVSYYAYLSIVLSEILWIWSFLPENAIAFTILLAINCLVICVFGILKRLYAFSRGERVVAKIYFVCVALVFIAGCFVNFLQNLVLYFLPIIFTALWVFLRNIQIMRFATSNSKILTTIANLFCNCLMWPLLATFVSLTPIVIFVYVLNLTLTSKLFVFLISILFAMILPFITWFEEEFVNENIFEIGYEIIFTKRIENLLKEINVSAEVFWTSEFADAVYKLAESEASDKDWEEFYKELKRIQVVLNKNKK